jgi:hypothetical protein
VDELAQLGIRLVRAHPAYGRSLDQLREMGVLVGSYEPHQPKAGGGAECFQWEEALELLEGRSADLFGR